MNDGRAEAYLFILFFIKLYLKVNSNSIIMLFNKNGIKANERILYKTKSNMLLGCKKAIYGLILLIIVFWASPVIIKFIGKMQVYLISHITLPLTRYTAIAFFVVILIIILYIIWQLLSWYALEYTLTDSKIIIKSGVLSTKKSYMPYATIQDVNTSQNILARLFNIGSVSVYSAYDNNQMELINISNPSHVEEIIFSNISRFRNFQHPSGYANVHYHDDYLNDDDYFGRDDFHDEFEPITPIANERDRFQRRDYEYSPRNLNLDDDYQQRHNYEYEPYGGRFGNDADGAGDDLQPQNFYSDKSYYDEIRDEYYYSDDYYDDMDLKDHYRDDVEEVPDVELDNSREKVIQRHFDKFKR